MRGFPANSFEALWPGVLTREDYRMGPEDRVVIADTTYRAVAVTLPARPEAGQIAIVKKSAANANALTIDGNGYLVDGLEELGTGATTDRVCCWLWFADGAWHAL